MTIPAITLRSVTKRFGTTIANRDLTLDIQSGTIHAIVGENGAGKSTLSNMIYGMFPPTSGTIIINGHPVTFTSPADAIQAGIGMVHQHFRLISNLTVTENIILGNESTPLLAPLSLRAARHRITELATDYGLDINPDSLVSQLGIGQRQRTEILKLLYRSASIMIFDEPTAVLTPAETDQLLATLDRLRQRNNTIILITHKLDEVLRIADTITVMSKGTITGTLPAATVTKTKLAEMMVGRPMLLRITTPPHTPGATRLKLDNLTITNNDGTQPIHNLTLHINDGEIYGIAGVEGNGQRELLQLLDGTLSTTARITGQATLSGTTLIGTPPRTRAARGIATVPEDRHTHAIITSYSVNDNLILGRHHEPAFHHHNPLTGGFNTTAIKQFSNAMTTHYQISTTNPARQPISELSGGNQQKTVIARELSRPGIKLLILAQPTRGVDIGAIETIYNAIINARQQGIAILLISSELDELTTLSTRIGCLYKGTIRQEISASELDAHRTDPEQLHRHIGMQIT